jgi:hypothetical protein
MSKKRQPVQPRPAPVRRRPATRRKGPPDWLLPVAIATGGLVALAVLVVLLFGRSSATPTRSTSFAGTGQPVDGVQCQSSEQAVYHIHAHLAIFANGTARTVPMGIGIPNAQAQDTISGPSVATGSCFYWLHTHAADGIIHVESPTKRAYTLGTFFDIWGETLSGGQVGSDTGTVTVYLNGRRYSGDPRSIPLTAHAVIQLDVGTNVAPRPYTFADGL